MSIDFNTITSAGNEDRVLQTSGILGFPRKKPELAVLNNRSKFNALNIDKLAPASQLYVSPLNNMKAGLFLTSGFGAPGVTFKADWNSSASFCLTYWQWGPGMWAQQELV